VTGWRFVVGTGWRFLVGDATPGPGKVSRAREDSI
jgi:hypothetical protein